VNPSLALPDLHQLAEDTKAAHYEVATAAAMDLAVSEDLLLPVVDVKSLSITSVVPCLHEY